MSGDLISKKALLEDFRNTITENSDTFDWLNMISRQPSAYDVDKVIEEIEDTINPTAEYRYKFCGTVEVGRCASYESCECCIAERMIEIVKSGGVVDEK